MQRRDFLLSGLWSGSLLSLPGWAQATAGASAVAGQGVDAPSSPVASMDDFTDGRRLDTGWRFHFGDIAFPPVISQDDSYDNAKTGRAWAAAAMDFDDGGWRTLRLPHDFVVEQPFSADANVAQGYRRRGIAWYRRTLRLDESLRGQALEVRFDGIASHATVWINGVLMERSWSGYSGICIDLTAIARYGEDLNTIAVRVDAEAMDGWWYEGGGLYRHAWLAVRAPLHIVADGLAAVPREHGDDVWTVPVEVLLENAGPRSASAQARATLYDPQGRALLQGSATLAVAALARGTARIPLRLHAPQRWSVTAPILYRLEVQIDDDQGGRDRRCCEIGFRSLRFDPDLGFFLNLQPLKIKGVCLHQDHAGVGVAVPDALHVYRIRRLKSIGCNAIRLHHAVAPELLQACDRLGMLVMAENRVFNSSPDYLALLQAMVRRQRNHPSVFLWSVLNEEPLQGTAAGYQIARRMVAAVKTLDDTRLVTAAMNDGMQGPLNVADAVDVIGFNYRQFNYDRIHAARPRVPLLSSEDTSAFQTRGAWFTDLQAQVIAEDDSRAADWGNTHAESWRMIAERPFIAGGFVWTGFDYRGEPTPFTWPSVGSFFGIMDQCGFAKGAYWQRRAQWLDDEPVLKLLPHWNWPGREGQSITVLAFCNAQQVELWRDGRPLGRQSVDRFGGNRWQLDYAPGVLEAVAFQDGREVARDRVETTGAAVLLRLRPDRARMRGDDRDAQPVTIDTLDAHGRPVPDAAVELRLEVEGGRLLGVGNGDPNSHDSEQGPQVRLFNGLAQAIVQGAAGAAQLTVRAVARGLTPATVTIVLDPHDASLADDEVEVTPPALVIDGWRRTPPFAQPPALDLQRRFGEDNPWGFAQPGTLEVAAERTGYVLYRTTFTPWAGIQQHGGLLSLGRFSGKAEVFLDGRAIARARAGTPLRVPLPPAIGERSLAVIVQVEAGRPFGLRDVVSVRPSDRR